MTAQDVLAERYGAPSRWSRRFVVAACVVVAAAFLGWLTWTAVVHGTPEAESELVAFEVVDTHTAEARVAVTRSDEDVEASCLVRAFAADHTTVGELVWTPEGPAEQVEEVSIRTERRATSVELVGCTTDEQARPR